MKRNVHKITEAILNGDNIRKSISEAAKFRQNSNAGDAYLNILYKPEEFLNLFKIWAKSSSIVIEDSVKNKISENLSAEEKSLLINIYAGKETLASLFNWAGAKVYEESTGEGYGYTFKIRMNPSKKAKLLSSISNKSNNPDTLDILYFENNAENRKNILFMTGNEYPCIYVNNTKRNESNEDIIEIKVDERRLCKAVTQGKLPQFDSAYKAALKSKSSFATFMKNFCLKKGLVDRIIDDFNAAKNTTELFDNAPHFKTIEELFRFYLKL